MLFKPMLGSQLSGSIGGVTASHNKGGAYFRQRATPTTGSWSPFKQAVRDAMGACSTRWVNVLAGSQRLAWTVYAANTTLTNRIGDPIKISGISMFNRCNVPRIQSGLSPATIDDAPDSLSGNASIDPITAIGDVSSSGDVTVRFNATDSWSTHAAGGLLIYVSPPVNPTVNFYAGGLRIIGAILGSNTLPPTSPTILNNVFNTTPGQRVFWRIFACDWDGRLSNVQKGSSIVT